MLAKNVPLCIHNCYKKKIHAFSDLPILEVVSFRIELHYQTVACSSHQWANSVPVVPGHNHSATQKMCISDEGVAVVVVVAIVVVAIVVVRGNRLIKRCQGVTTVNDIRREHVPNCGKVN